MSATAEELLTRHKLTVHDYHRMGEAGIFHEDDRVELIDGEIIDMAPIGSDHAGFINRLTRRFVMRLGDRAVLGVQNPVRLGDYSEPQPDFSVLKPRADDYISSIPVAADVLLLIEVANSSLGYDRKIKLPLYARHGIPEVWILNVPQRLIEAHRAPGPDGYATVSIHGTDSAPAPVMLPDLPFELRTILEVLPGNQAR